MTVAVLLRSPVPREEAEVTTKVLAGPPQDTKLACWKSKRMILGCREVLAGRLFGPAGV